MVIWRLPRQKKLTGRSACARCGHRLSWPDLFPIFSFLFLRARCRYCKEKISIRYPLIELSTGAMFAGAFFIIRPEDALGFVLLAKAFAAIFVMTAVFMIDLEHFLILDSVLWPSALVFLALNLILDIMSGRNPGGLNSLTVLAVLSALAAALPFYLIWHFSKGKWMGFGDVKLALLLGVMLGWPLVFVSLFLGIILGGICGIFLLIFGNKTLKSKLPLGTFLSVAGIFVLFWGQGLLKWYLAFLGF